MCDVIDPWVSLNPLYIFQRKEFVELLEILTTSSLTMRKRFKTSWEIAPTPCPKHAKYPRLTRGGSQYKLKMKIVMEIWMFLGLNES